TESRRRLGRLRTGAGERALGLRFHRKRLGRSEMIRQSSRTQHLFAAALIAGASSLLLVQPAFASANIEGLLQNVVDMLTGNTARLLAVLAVVVVGILWMFGLFDLRRAAIVVLGIIVVFGAAEIVNLITGGA